MTDIDLSAAFSSGGMISRSMFATAVNLTGPTGTKGFITTVWIGRRMFYGITAGRSMFATNSCPMTKG